MMAEMYRSTSARRELGMRSGPFTGGAVLLPWDAIDMKTRRRLLAVQPLAGERRRAQTFAVFAVACACGFSLVLMSGSGFGRVDDVMLVQPSWLALLYALLLAGIVAPSVWLARRVLSAGAWFPYARAVLQLDALERTPRGLVVRPFGDARFAVIEQGFLELQYADGSTFRVRTSVPPDTLNVAIGFAEEILSRASLSDDRTMRDTLDPLTALRDDRGFVQRARTTKLAGDRSTRDRFPFVVAVLVLASFAASLPLLALRNRTSDDAGFAFARRENVREHYESYLTDGGKRHAREVNADLLPRLVLDDAKKHDDIEELARYLQRFPHSRFDDEARSALATTCMRRGDDRTWTSNWNVFDDLEKFSEEHVACKPYMGDIYARYFAVRRSELRYNFDIEPALRDMLLGLLDRAERSRSRARLRIVVDDGKHDGDGDAGNVQWALGESMRRFVGRAINVDASRKPDTGDRIEITLSALPCASYERPRGQIAHVELYDGTTHVDWWRRMPSDGMFQAITSREEPPLQSLCFIDIMPHAR
jgi:hypothetical protein